MPAHHAAIKCTASRRPGSTVTPSAARTPRPSCEQRCRQSSRPVSISDSRCRPRAIAVTSLTRASARIGRRRLVKPRLAPPRLQIRGTRSAMAGLPSRADSNPAPPATRRAARRAAATPSPSSRRSQQPRHDQGKWQSSQDDEASSGHRGHNPERNEGRHTGGERFGRPSHPDRAARPAGASDHKVIDLTIVARN
jgi:hypothetical protein